MTITIDLPDPAALPVWAWVAIGAAAWYALAALVIRLGGRRLFRAVDFPAEEMPELVVFLWAFSPVVFPLFSLGAMFVAFGRLVLMPRR